MLKKMLKNLDKAWDIRLEGRLNKNNIVFQKKYHDLYHDLKKVDNQIKKSREKYEKKKM